MHLLTYLIFIAYPTFTLCQSPLPSTNLSPHKPESCKWTNNDCKELKTNPEFDTNCAEDGDGEVFSCSVECMERPTEDRCKNYCKKYKLHYNSKLLSVTTTPSATTVGYTQAPAYRPQDCKWTSEDCRKTDLNHDPDFDTNCANEVFSCSVECEERPTGDRCVNNCKNFREDCKDSLNATTETPETPENHEHDCKCPEREDQSSLVWKAFTFLFLAFLVAVDVLL